MLCPQTSPPSSHSPNQRQHLWRSSERRSGGLKSAGVGACPCSQHLCLGPNVLILQGFVRAVPSPGIFGHIATSLRVVAVCPWLNLHFQGLLLWGQLWSKNTTWKNPEMNNSDVWNYFYYVCSNWNCSILLSCSLSLCLIYVTLYHRWGWIRKDKAQIGSQSFWGVRYLLGAGMDPHRGEAAIVWGSQEKLQGLTVLGIILWTVWNHS